MRHRAVLVAWLPLVLSGSIAAQSPVVSPSRISFRAVGIGPLGPTAKITIHISGEWTIAVSDAQWLEFKPAKGTGDATVTVGLVGWAVSRLQPGAHPAKATVRAADGALAVIEISLEVAPAQGPPTFTYLAGPSGCSPAPGYPDEARCIPPDEKPPGTFSPPPEGGTYVDANFGARVRVLAGPRSTHGYAAPSPLSPKNTYALVQRDGVHTVVEVATGKVVAPMPTSVEGAFWDAVNDDVFYYLRDSSVMSYNVRLRKSEAVVNYSGAPYRFTVIKDGFRNDSSRDNWIAFFAPRESRICALELGARRTYCASYEPGVVGVQLNASNAGAMMSKGVDRVSGKRYVLLNALPMLAIYSVNIGAGKLDFESLGPEVLDWGGNGDGVCNPGERCLRGDHFDTFEDSQGRQWLLGTVETPTPCEYALMSFHLGVPQRMGIPVELGGGRRRIMPLFQCGGVDTWTDVHIGCSKAAPYCAVSTTYVGFNEQLKADRKEPIKHTAHLAEVMVVRDNGVEVRRLLKHRSVPLAGEEANSYWTTPRAAISNDGSYVVLDSNFGESGQTRVLLVDTGFGNPTRGKGSH